MSEVAHSIDLNLSEKLRERDYRRKFFLAESSARIAAQIIALRKRRGLNQKELAEITGTHQPAISRAEQADYQNWSFNTLRRIADALDARIRVFIEPSEDILGEYEQEAKPVTARASAIAALESDELATPRGSALAASIDRPALRFGALNVLAPDPHLGLMNEPQKVLASIESRA